MCVCLCAVERLNFQIVAISAIVICSDQMVFAVVVVVIIIALAMPKANRCICVSVELQRQVLHLA